MPFDELDQLMKHYLNPNAYSNMCEVIDNIRTKVDQLSVLFLFDQLFFSLILFLRVELEKFRVIQREIILDERYLRINLVPQRMSIIKQQKKTK